MKRSLLLFICLSLCTSVMPGQKKQKIDLEKKIADATPQLLPQSPRSDKPISDARDQNLKGRVRNVSEQTPEPRDANRFYGKQYFDEDGNLLKIVYYIHGYPSMVTVWGYIDGERVSRSGEIKYASGEIPETSLQRSLTDVPGSPRDPRYDKKYRYKYDDRGRLIDSSVYENNGELVARTSYIYDGASRDQRTNGVNYQESRTLFILDKNGDAIEERLYSYDQKRVVETFIYVHQLDKHRNWIVERYFRKKQVAGKAHLELLWTARRTITYYQ